MRILSDAPYNSKFDVCYIGVNVGERANVITLIIISVLFESDNLVNLEIYHSSYFLPAIQVGQSPPQSSLWWPHANRAISCKQNILYKTVTRY